MLNPFNKTVPARSGGGSLAGKEASLKQGTFFNAPAPVLKTKN